MRDRHLSALPGRDAGLNIPLYQGVAEPVRIMAAVRQKVAGLRQRRQERPRADVIAGLSCGEKHADRPAFAIGHGVQLGVQPALGAPDEPFAPPFYPEGWRPCDVP